MGVNNGHRLRPFLGDVWGTQEITLVQDKLSSAKSLPGLSTSEVKSPARPLQTSRLKGGLDRHGGPRLSPQGRGGGGGVAQAYVSRADQGQVYL